MLKNRKRCNLSKEEVDSFKNSMRIFATNLQTYMYNIRQLQEANKILYCITSQKIKTKQLEKDFNAHAEKDFTNLHENLWLSVGTPVYLTVNLNPAIGLYNSSEGVVVDIIYHDDDKNGENLPKYVLVEFDEYKGLKFDERNIFPVAPIELNNEA